MKRRVASILIPFFILSTLAPVIDGKFLPVTAQPEQTEDSFPKNGYPAAGSNDLTPPMTDAVKLIEDLEREILLTNQIIELRKENKSSAPEPSAVQDAEKDTSSLPSSVSRTSTPGSPGPAAVSRKDEIAEMLRLLEEFGDSVTIAGQMLETRRDEPGTEEVVSAVSIRLHLRMDRVGRAPQQ